MQYSNTRVYKTSKSLEITKKKLYDNLGILLKIPNRKAMNDIPSI